MRVDDLPPSENVADRRSKPEPRTFQEKLDRALSEPRSPVGPSGAEDSDLAKQLGRDDVGKV